MSRPLRARELKPFMDSLKATVFLSRPLRARELKHGHVELASQLGVAPLAGA